MEPPDEFDHGFDTFFDQMMRPNYRAEQAFARVLPVEVSSGWIWNRPYYKIRGRSATDETLTGLKINIVRKHGQYLLSEEDYIIFTLAVEA